MPKGRMVLSIGGAQEIVDPSDAQIQTAISGLDTKKGDAFVILGPNDMTYLQASGDKLVGFDLEFQAGATSEHFRAKNECIAIEDIIEVCIAYRDAVPDWNTKFEFERIAW